MRFTRFLRSTWILAALLMIPFTGFAAETIKIGLMAPIVGPWASEGQDMQRVVSLLVDEVNAKGGIKGRPVELIIEDDAGDPRTAALAAQKLVSSDVIAIIGTYGSAVTEASQSIIDEAEVLQIANGSTSVRLTEKGLPLFFRTNPRDDTQGVVIADTIKKKGYKRIAVLHDNSSYSKGLADEAVGVLKKKYNMEPVFYDVITAGERDYSSILTKVKGAKPDLILATVYYPEAGTLLRQRDEMGWDVPMMGGDSVSNIDLVKIAGKKAAEGYSFISPTTPENFTSPEAKTFLAKYEKKHGEYPTSMWAVLAGDGFNAIVEALEKGAAAEPKAIAKYFKETLKDYPGITGKFSFDKKGDRVGDLYLLHVVDKDGNFVIQQ